MSNKKVLILGCGWSGKITANLFLQNNISVWGSTTQPNKIDDLKNAGIHPILLNFSKESYHKVDTQKFKQQEFELIIISVNVRRDEDRKECLEKFNNIITFIKPIYYKQVVFLSSIGVYEPIDGVIIETSEMVKDGNLYLIEEYLKLHLKPLVILRLGGLFGYGRIPGKYFSNKTCTVGNEKANYIHGDDVAQAIFEIFKMVPLSDTYNLVAPVHPSKKEIYNTMANKYKFAPVLYKDGEIIQKEVSSIKITEKLGYQFKIPSPLDF